ncbi:unnamed protein product [Brassicogethes aeneus]|uniref:C2H2-type domain-containing protein n=1 Tax=Brassicogethes aeneus TaxID=1431903 RepID=A0A9P0BA96_BRAAE|nr:unnamed protein product [Brassicogethes aeneus]
MEKPLNCVLCGGNLANLNFYNLMQDFTKSRTLLIKLISNCTKYLDDSTYLICEQCYGLLNDLDELYRKAKFIENNFVSYVANKSREKVECKTKTEKLDIFNADENLEPKYYKENKETPEEKPPTFNFICHSLKKFNTQKSYEAQNKLPYICEICGRIFRQNHQLKMHLRFHNGEKPFECEFCKKSFTQKCALTRHLPLHTGKKPHQCDVCGKCFIHHTSFNLHKLSHKGEKPYKCEFCGLALMSGSHLTRHRKTHTGEKKHACAVCGKSFAEKYNLSAHEKQHTVEGGSNRKFKCQICDKFFQRKVKFQEHRMNAHQASNVTVLDDLNVKKET